MPRRVVRAAFFVFSLPKRRSRMVAHSDSAVNVLTRCHPVQIAATIVAFVTVDVVDLGAGGAAAEHEYFGNKNVDANISLKLQIAQFHIDVTVLISRSMEESSGSCVEYPSVRVD